MADCVYESIPTIVPPPRSIEITQNGDYNVDFLDSVTVNVSGGSTPVLESLSVTANGTYTPSAGVDGFDSVDVNVSGGGGGDELLNSIIDKTVSGSITITASTVGTYAFAECQSLVSIDLPNAVQIDPIAFSSCTSLAFVNIPNVTEIGLNAFFYCKNLTSVNMPNVIKIKSSAFFSCSSLTSVDLPNATTLEASTFLQCIGLASVSIPNVSSIGAAAFRSCTALTSISLPKLSSFNSSVFQNCYNLLSVYLPGSSLVGLKASNAFTSTPIAGYTASTGGVLGSIFVPSSLYSNYVAASAWSYFNSRFASI